MKLIILVISLFMFIFTNVYNILSSHNRLPKVYIGHSSDKKGSEPLTKKSFGGMMSQTTSFRSTSMTYLTTDTTSTTTDCNWSTANYFLENNLK